MTRHDAVSTRTRRAFLRASLLAHAFPAGVREAWPQSQVRRIAWLAATGGVLGTPTYLEALRAGLRERGWVDGINLAIETRFGHPDSAAALAEELLRGRPEVLVAHGVMVLGARKVVRGIPVVFTFSGDPVEAGLVRSFARPGGDLTGIAMHSVQLVGKRLQLLREIIPNLSRAAILANPRHAGEQLEWREAQAAAERLGIAWQYLRVRTTADVEAAFVAIDRGRAEAVVVFADALTMSLAPDIARLSRAQGIPAVSSWSEFVDAGNFMSYGPNVRSTSRQAASHVDKLLRGAQAAELPVEQPASYELVINERLASELRLSIPESLRLQASRIVT